MIDLKFMDHIRFNSFVPANKTEVDKAIHEYNCLKENQKKLNNLYERQVLKLYDQKHKADSLISGAMEEILKGVETCISNHKEDFNIEYGDNNKCSLTFEHGNIVLEEIRINKLKIKPKEKY